MLRTNLSTRPFYNERVVHLLIALAGVIVVAITLFNVLRVVELSRHNTELSARVGRDRDEAQRLTRDAIRVRGGIDQKELAVVAAAAREANTLIDQRTFSWTAFFNHLEATLPPDVMILTVRPTVGVNVTRITMTVVGKTAEDIDEFIEKLEATGDFESILATQTDRTEDGLKRAVLEAAYSPVPDEAKADGAAEAPAPAERPAPGRTGSPAPPAAPAPSSKTVQRSEADQRRPSRQLAARAAGDGS